MNELVCKSLPPMIGLCLAWIGLHGVNSGWMESIGPSSWISGKRFPGIGDLRVTAIIAYVYMHKLYNNKVLCVEHWST